MAMQRIQSNGVRWRLAAGIDIARLAPRLARSLADLDAGNLSNLRSGRRKELYELVLGAGPEPDHLLKVNRYPGWRGYVRRVRGSKAWRELRMAQAVAERGIPTPIPIAAGERIAGGRLNACYLLVPRLEGAIDLQRLLGEARLGCRERRVVAAAFGALTRRIHDAGVFQDDFAPNNFLVELGEAPQVAMIDFERARLRRRLGLRKRRHMLAKLERRMGRIRSAERMRFLHAYCRGDRQGVRFWWQLLDSFAPRLVRRDLARLRRVTTRPGRRFHPVQGVGFRGYARRDVRLTDLVFAEPQGSQESLGTSAPWRMGLGRLSLRQRADIWVRANLLWMRGFAPRPLAILGRESDTELLLERPAGWRRLCDVPVGERTPAPLVALFRPLLSLGALDPGIQAGDVALTASSIGGPTASLLGPHRIALGRPAPGLRREQARKLAAALIRDSAPAAGIRARGPEVPRGG
jgi:hypothetical protein